VNGLYPMLGSPRNRSVGPSFRVPFAGHNNDRSQGEAKPFARRITCQRQRLRRALSWREGKSARLSRDARCAGLMVC
jgi:hypothetical protein